MGGDHKCPLCSATFTRPQHVGRHLRAHTGDRPYECKECPLRFARSDLLSRHVNKAHPKPGGAGDGKGDKKKGRSKSMSTSMPGRPPPPPPPMVVRMPPGPPAPPPLPEHTPYQAQRMYPNHPLLQQNANAAWPPDIWGSGVANFGLGMGQHPPPVGHLASDVIGAYGNATAAGMTFLHPVTGQPVYAASDPSAAFAAGSAYDLNAPATVPGAHVTNPPQSVVGYDLHSKKRACDQCNHSKVRCDFAVACARCNHRQVQCTYSKPQVKGHRTRHVTHPIPKQLSTSPPNALSQAVLHKAAAATHGASGRSSPAAARPLNDDAAAMARRSSDHSSGTSDAAFSEERVRPPVPDPRWDTVPPTQARSQSMGTTASFVSQSSTLGLALTPTLTEETSSSGADTDRRDSQVLAAAMGSNWALPSSVMTEQSTMPLVDGFVPQTDSALQTAPQGLWLSNETGPLDPRSIDTTILPSESALSSAHEDDTGTTPPNTGIDKDSPRRRRSSAVWANALRDMHLDDSVPMLDASNLEGLPFGDMPLDRKLSNSDLNLWKLFLDPGVLASPDEIASLKSTCSETPRALNKSNSAPDLTTPSINFPNPLDFIGQRLDMADSDGEIGAFAQQREGNNDGSEDDEDMSSWKEHIQHRHASFSMNPDAAASVRTRALTYAKFASAANARMRPALHPLLHTTGGDMTLAPARLPSFGPTFDMYGILTPDGHLRGSPKTPGGRQTPGARQPTAFSKTEARPGNKRQASQTLVGENQKRGTFLVWSDDDGMDSIPSSRHGSGALPGGCAKAPANVPAVAAPAAEA